MVLAARMLAWECHFLLLWHWRGVESLVRKAAPRDKRCSGPAVGLVVAVRYDMMVGVLRAPIVKTWARCSEHQDDPSY